MTESLTSQKKQLTHKWSIVVAWLLSAVIAVFAVRLSHDRQVLWQLFAIAAVVLVTFFLQLATAERQGFIVRTALSISGALVVQLVVDPLARLLG